ncbi:MAG: hypothetical protein U0802_22620 [Candidatus Binatia bacterium]
MAGDGDHGLAMESAARHHRLLEPGAGGGGGAGRMVGVEFSRVGGSMFGALLFVAGRRGGLRLA